ncbi:metallophosphoesterase family protein [Algirhabdus cladophorae]|uniref:metallophosphoesterase family protein n=1 Tax=Algirhabdus cladophorae TaxID=3377108 RepID=UPI003B8452E3
MLYAIGDVHGQHEMLLQALALIHADGGSDAQIVFVGDYVDRGPDSRAVIQTLMDGQAAGKNWITLKGNHDRYVTRFLDDMIINDSATRPDLMWFNPRLGGDKTLLSYGVHAEDGKPVEPVHEAALKAVPKDHRTWLEHLPLTFETDDLFFCHAGIRPGIPLDQQVENDLIWIRQGWLEFNGTLPKQVIHGHTALEHPQHHGNRVNLDGGAGYFRPLHPAVYDDGDWYLLMPAGRIKLDPIPAE